MPLTTKRLRCAAAARGGGCAALPHQEHHVARLSEGDPNNLELLEARAELEDPKHAHEANHSEEPRLSAGARLERKLDVEGQNGEQIDAVHEALRRGNARDRGWGRVRRVSEARRDQAGWRDTERESEAGRMTM